MIRLSKRGAALLLGGAGSLALTVLPMATLASKAQMGNMSTTPSIQTDVAHAAQPGGSVAKLDQAEQDAQDNYNSADEPNDTQDNEASATDSSGDDRGTQADAAVTTSQDAANQVPDLKDQEPQPADERQQLMDEQQVDNVNASAEATAQID